MLQSIRFDPVNCELEILDQLLLPEKTQYVKIKGVEDGWSVINKMQVRSYISIGGHGRHPVITSHIYFPLTITTQHNNVFNLIIWIE